MKTRTETGTRLSMHILDELSDIRCTVNFMGYAQRAILTATDTGELQFEMPTDEAIHGLYCIYSGIQSRLAAVTSCIEDNAIFPE